MSKAYRGDDEAAKARLSERWEAARRLELRLSPRYWRHAESQRRLRDELRAQAEQASENGDVERCDALLVEYIGVLERAIAAAPELAEQLEEWPTEAPGVQAPSPGRSNSLLIESVLTQLSQLAYEQLQSRLEGFGEAVEGHPAGRASWVGSGFFANVHIRWAATFFVGQSGMVEPQLRFTAALPYGVPELLIRQQTWGHGITKALGLQRDVEVGDTQFDELFLVEAEPEAAGLLLTPPVRKTLLKLCRFDVPTLRIVPGSAVLDVSYDPEPAVLRLCVGVLQALRGVRMSVDLLR